MCKTLGSIPSTEKQKKEREKKTKEQKKEGRKAKPIGGVCFQLPAHHLEAPECEAKAELFFWTCSTMGEDYRGLCTMLVFLLFPVC
jgi:hypothetical protein